MTTIASLRVGLEADATKLKKGLEGAKDSVKRFGVASLAVGGGLGVIVQKGLDSADALQKMSIRTGVGVEALSALEHAASLSAVEMPSLEKGLVSMNRAIGEALDGTQAQAEAFEGLGINIQALAKLKPEQQFGVIADQLNKVQNEAIKARLGSDIFGGGFRKLGPLLAIGSAGMAEAADEAERLGVLLSQADAEGAARANDAMQRLKNTISGVARTMSIELAPGIAEFLENFGKKIPAILASVKAAFLGVGSVIGGVAAALGAAFSGEFSQAANILRSIPDQTRAAISEATQPTATGAASSNAVSFSAEADSNLKGINEKGARQLEALEYIRQELTKRQVAVAG